MKDSYEDEEEEVEGPKSSFSTYLAEGDALFKQGDYRKALESYSLALDIKPDDKTCLVSRSKCHLMLGDAQAALKDAEASLEVDKEFSKGLYQKAEALYSMGDFEYALMFYHRGYKLRPELGEFRLGIQKAQEAIDNSIGNAAKVKLENKGDLSFFAKQDDVNKKSKGYSKPTTTKPKTVQNRNKEVKTPAPSNKTVKQLLGELYADKEYLEKLMEDSNFINGESNTKVRELVQDGLTYLNKRTDFWRQQKPLYARRKDTRQREKKKYATRDQAAVKKLSKFMKKLEEIDAALSDGQAEKSLRLAKTTLKEVQETSASSVNNRDEIISNLHSCIGNALLDLDKPQKALKHHLDDLSISEKNNHSDGKSRALDNIGRSYARIGNYEKAVESWKKKVPLVKTPLESTWLHHELGRCHLEMGCYSEARDYGEQSLNAAEEAEDEVWQLNASVLIAQADVKLDDLDKALSSFDKSMNLAKSLDDEAAQSAISKAVNDLKAQMEKGGNSAVDEDKTVVHEDKKEEADESETKKNEDDTPEDDTPEDSKNAASEETPGNIPDQENEDEKIEDEKTEDEKTEDEKTEDEKIEDSNTENKKSEDQPASAEDNADKESPSEDEKNITESDNA